MTWQVTYRNRNGEKVEEFVEAENRQEVFTRFRTKVVHVISIVPAKSSKQGDGKDRSKMMRNGVLIFSLVVIILLVIASYLLSVPKKDMSQKSEGTAKEEKTIRKDVVKSKPQSHIQQPLATQQKEAPLSNWDIRHLSSSDTNRLTEAEFKYWKMYHPNPPPDRDQPQATHGKYRIFKHKADNDIAFVVATEPGTLIIGERNLGQGFKERFLKSIKTPIVINDTDSEYDKNLKQTIIQARAELKSALESGEDIGKILDDARSTLQKLGRYKMNLEKEALKTMSKKDITARDAEDMISAMNKMLESKGIAPIELNSISRLALKFQSLKSKEEKEKKQ